MEIIKKNSVEYVPKKAALITDWADKVDLNNPHPEYPRPQLVRQDWVSLNGVWDLDVEGHKTEKILVPFCVESALSGVMKKFKAEDSLIYRRQFVISDAWAGRRILLRFEAVDYFTTVLVNGHRAGTHQGGESCNISQL